MRVLVALVVCASCSFTDGRAKEAPDGAGSGSGSGSALAPNPGKSIVAGGGRVSAGTITMDVQIGYGILPRKSTAGTFTINAAPVVKP
jgi:hypothetical protein